MITKNDCWLQRSCKKFKENNCVNDMCERLIKTNALYELALLSPQQKYRTDLFYDQDGTDELQFRQLHEVQVNIKQFVNGGYNLYIFSTICGNGKSSWAIRMIQAFLNSVWIESNIECRALFINVPRYLLGLKEFSNSNEYVQYIKDNVLKADLVVWDEFACKTLTDFEHDQLLNIINTRIENKKSNIYTSNIGGEDLRQRVGDRLYSRITGYCTVIELNGADKRSKFR